MGIREVMVIVGGKSVGDVVELLADGAHFGLDLTYRYQRGALGIAHAIGLARDFVGDDAFCCVLGDNILRGPALDARSPASSRPGRGAPGRCSTASRTRSGSASPSSTPTGSVVGFEEKPAAAEERPDPDRGLLPPPGRVRRHRPPRAVRPRRVRDHRRAQPLHPRAAACSAAVYDGHWTDAGTVAVAAPGRRARPRRRRRPAASRRRSSGRSGERPVTERATSGRPPRHRRRRLHRLVLRPRRPRPARRDPDHGPRQADLRRQPRPTSPPVEADPEQAARLRFVQGDIADPDVVGPLVADADAVVNFAAESHVDRSILDPEAFLRTGVIGVHVLLEAVRGARRRADAAGPLPPGLDRRGLRLGRDGPLARGRSRSRRARRTRRRRPPASCSSRSYVATHGVDAVVTRGSNTYGPYHHPEKLIPLFVTNAIDDQPLPLYGDGLQRRDWLYVADHAGAIDHVLRHGATRRDLQRARARAEMTNRDVVAALLERLGKPWSLVRHVAGPARPRPALRDGRLEARGARLAEPDVVRGRPGGDGRLVPRQRGVVAGGQVRRLGRLLRAPVRARGWRRSTRAPRLTGARRRHRRRRAARPGARRGARGRRRSPGRPARSPGPGATFDLDAPDGDRRAARPRPARGRRPRRGLDRRRRLRPRAGARAAPERRGDRRPRRGDCAARGIDLVLVVDERGLRRPADRRARLRARTTRTNPINPYGASKLAGETRGGGRLRAARRGARLGIVRTAWLFGPPGNDFPAKILAAAERAARGRRAAPGRRRRVRLADVHARPRRGDRRAARLGRRRRASTTSSTAASPRGPTGRASCSARPGCDVDDRGGPGIDLGARLDAAGLGRPRADAAARRRAAPAVARGARRLPADPPRGSGAAARAAMRTSSDRRPPCRASASARSPVTPTRAARSASCGGESAFPALTPSETGAPAGTRAAVRPGQPVDVGRRRPARAALPPPPARLLDRRLRSGARRPRRRPAAARRDRRPRRRSRRASSRPTSGSSSRPASPTGSSPSSRSSCSTS